MLGCLGILVIVVAMAAGCGSKDITTEAVLALLQQPIEAATSEPVVWRQSQIFNPAKAPQIPADSAGKFWRKFRDAYPYGLQAIVVSNPDSKGRYTVIVAEPPPHVTLEQIRSVMPDACVMKQPVLHDGGLFDVAGTVSGGASAVHQALLKLNVMLYRTLYKAYVLHEPFRHTVETSRYNLNVSPTASEVYSWLYAKNAEFIGNSGGGAVSLGGVKSKSESEVFHLKGSRLIVWWIPPNVPISHCLMQARQFALDSDILTGAIRDRGLLICGRPRMAPYDVLPPTRVETIALLASVSVPQLAQSYQRNHPAAGLYTKTFDWAPILLSPELVDTEYGYLLNVADQMLKGWSERGTVHYEKFNYPPPGRWPFPRPLIEIVGAGRSRASVTFNWNTIGGAYGIRVGNAQVYVPNRTGALPVSYNPGEVAYGGSAAMKPLEDTGYSYFAGLQNPVLVRVAQYASLYQIFFNLRVTPPQVKAPADNGPEKAFKSTMEGFWRRVDEMDEGGLEKVKADYHVQSDRTNADANVISQYRQQEAQSIDAAYRSWRQTPPELKSAIESSESTLQGPDQRQFMAMQEAIERARPFLSAVAANSMLPDGFARAVHITGHSWIHTPTIVLSNNGANSYRMTGGHNLYAPYSDYVLNPRVPRGHPQILGNDLHINPDDRDRLTSDIVHNVARTLSDPSKDPASAPSTVAAYFSGSPPRRPRRPEDALGFRNDPPEDSGNIFVLAPAAQPAVSDDRNDADHAMEVKVVKAGNNFLLSRRGDAPIMASNLGDVTAIAWLYASSTFGGNEGVHINIEGQFSKEEVKAIETGIKAASTEKDARKDIVAVVESREGGALPRLDPNRYDLNNPKITIDYNTDANNRQLAHVAVVIPPKVGTRKAFMDFLFRAHESATKSTLTNTMEAFKQRVVEVLKAAAGGSVKFPSVLLHIEARRLGEDRRPVEDRVELIQHNFWEDPSEDLRKQIGKRELVQDVVLRHES
jgi:hypothetical protein